MDVVHDGRRMQFVTPNAYTKWRVETIRTKEPCTLEWIAGMQPGDVLVDVGANVGMYSIWAAATRGVEVRAFEPEAQNFALLNQNIFINGLGHMITAYPVGLADTRGLTVLHMSDMRAGASCHALGDALDYKGEALNVLHEQGSVAARLDDLREKIPQPTHIKIDVDGFESRVVAGGLRTIAKARSVLIEVNPALGEHQDMLWSMHTLGFEYDPAQVTAATRKDGPFKGVAEYVFFR